jgi:hypothetical protein
VTIEKGTAWGEPWSGGVDLPTAADDRALARLVEPHLVEDLDDAPAVRVTGGDLARTLGVEGGRDPDGWYRYPIDGARVDLVDDDGTHRTVVFVAHLTVRNRRWTGIGPGLSVAVMNAAWLGDLRLGPRAHPNDGRFDLTEGTVGFWQRREGTRRARHGGHLPHPGLRVSRVTSWEHTFARPESIWLDGQDHGRFRSVAVEIIPDGFTVVG